MKQFFFGIITSLATVALVSVASAQTSDLVFAAATRIPAHDPRFSDLPLETNAGPSSAVPAVTNNVPAVTNNAPLPTNTPAMAPYQLEPAPTPLKNRIGLSYRLGLNVSVDFNHLGGYTLNNPLVTPDGLAYNYDTGYVYPDNFPNQHPGLTWNYGYVGGVSTANSQFSLYQSSSPGETSSKDNYGDPQHGLELTYNHQLGTWHKMLWGLETGFGFTDFTIQDNKTLSATVVHTTNTFATAGGVALIPSPFQRGNENGPPPNDPNGWPLVGITPVGAATTGTFAGAATISGSRSIEARILSLRLGPYLDYPISKKWTASLSAGLSLVYINSEFKYNETVSIDSALSPPNMPLLPENHSGSGTTDDFLVGGYVGGSIAYSLTERWRLFTGAQWQGTGNLARYQGTKEAVFNLGASVFVNFGVSYSF
jgi:hypothetical protein